MLRQAILLSALCANGFFAFAESSDEKISPRAVHSVTVGISTNPTPTDLDRKLSLQFRRGSLKSLFDETGRQTGIEFVLTGGLDQCKASVFVHDMPVRDLLQMLLFGGVTFQNIGRPGRYFLVRRHGGPECPPKTSAPAGSCRSLNGAPLSLECENGSISQLTELLYAQSDANFAVWNEAVDHPIDVRLEGSTLSKALQKLTKDHSLAVRRGSHGNSLVFLSPALDIPLQQPTPQESTVARSTATLVIPSRQEPPADPTLAPAASNNSAQ